MEDEGERERLRTAALAVYAVPPAGFIAARKEWVTRLRSEGHKELAKEVGALRKPSVAAAAINALVRGEAEVVAQLRDLGTRMRHAQSAMDAAGLTALRGDRDRLLADWVAAARDQAPSALTGAAGSEVRDTAVAALADADATEVVLSGTLTRALSYSGFGEVDIADAVARTSTGVVLTRIDGGGEGAGADSGEAETEERDPDPDQTPHLAHPTTDQTPDLAHLRAELESTESAVAGARDARREAASALEGLESKVVVAASGVEQARRLLAQAEQHAAKAQAAVEQGRERLMSADDDLTTARGHRDSARARLEEAEDES